jgi:hypothetical protein
MLKYTLKVDPLEAEAYAQKHNMGFYEISTFFNFNITEIFQVILNKNIRNKYYRSKLIYKVKRTKSVK